MALSPEKKADLGGSGGGAVANSVRMAEFTHFSIPGEFDFPHHK
jgi:hypothetical protein